MNETELAAELAGIKARLSKLENSKTSSGDVSTERPRYDFEIRIGRDKGKTPSQLASSALESLAAFMDKCAANPQPGKENFVESNRKAAGNYRRWAAYKRAVEQGLVTDSIDTPATATPSRYGTSGHGGSAKHTSSSDLDYDGYGSGEAEAESMASAMDDVPF